MPRVLFLLQLPHKQQMSNGAVKPTNLPTNSRKRPHNTPPILESVVGATVAATSTVAATATASATSSAAPPPLLPRARPTHADSVIANNLESNQQKRWVHHNLYINHTPRLTYAFPFKHEYVCKIYVFIPGFVIEPGRKFLNILKDYLNALCISWGSYPVLFNF